MGVSSDGKCAERSQAGSSPSKTIDGKRNEGQFRHTEAVVGLTEILAEDSAGCPQGTDRAVQRDSSTRRFVAT